VIAQQVANLAGELGAEAESDFRVEASGVLCELLRDLRSGEVSLSDETEMVLFQRLEGVLRGLARDDSPPVREAASILLKDALSWEELPDDLLKQFCGQAHDACRRQFDREDDRIPRLADQVAEKELPNTLNAGYPRWLAGNTDQVADWGYDAYAGATKQILTEKSDNGQKLRFLQWIAEAALRADENGQHA